MVAVFRTGVLTGASPAMEQYIGNTRYSGEPTPYAPTKDFMRSPLVSTPAFGERPSRGGRGPGRIRRRRAVLTGGASILLCDDPLGTDRLRASSRQHPVQDRHADGRLGLLGREAAGSQPGSDHRLVATHCRFH